MDVDVPGMLRAVILRAPVMGSTVKSFDEGAARSVKGIVDIFQFERGVAVVAEKYWQAQKAANLVTVQWNDDSNLQRFNTDELREACRQSVQRPGSKIKNEGDTSVALNRTDLTHIEATYESPYLAHAPMEPMNAAAHVRDGEVEIWAPVQ
jgi:isoquinoline 1-oxidoreductase beta subunit